MTDLPVSSTRRAPFVIGAAACIVTMAAYFLGASYAPDVVRAPTHSPRAAILQRPTVLAQVQPQTFEQLTPEQAVLLNSRVPISMLPKPSAAPFVLTGVSEAERVKAETCLTMAVYYEAANQGEAGEAAVAQVVLNRLRNPMFPKSVCGVVFQGSSLPTGCQFTFTCDGSLSREPSAEGWRQANEVAKRALAGYVEKDVGEATHYHTIWVVPYWQPTVVKIAQLGAHIFYRWHGELGQPRAFEGKYQGNEPDTPLPPGISDLISTARQPVIARVIEAEPLARSTVRAVVSIAEAPRAQPDIKGIALVPHLDTSTPLNPTNFSRDDQPRNHLPM